MTEKERGGIDGQVEVIPAMAVGSLKYFGAALIGSTQGLLKRRELHR